MQQLQLLSVPATHHDMTFSISCTGITRLKESRYKARHNLPTKLVQTPNEGIITKKHYKTIMPDIREPKNKRNVRKKLVVDTPNKPKKVRLYRIDKREVTHRIKQFVNQMKGEKMLYFWTITFPDKTSDDTAFILLNKWLTRLRQESMIKEYLWITERQQNGTIHFHMVINHKMNVYTANKYMRASIMHCINEGEINYSREAAKKYNGVDIAKDRKTKRVVNFAIKKKQKALSNYLTKYVTKNNSEFTHLAWHSSRGYSNLITQIRLTYLEISQLHLIDETDTTNKLDSQYFEFYRWKKEPPKLIMSYFTKVNQYIQSLLN